MTNEKINLLIVDDNTLTLLGVKSVLNTKNFAGKIFDAKNPSNALNVIENNKVDIVITGIGVADNNALAFVKKIKEVSPLTKIIVLTSIDSKEVVINCFKLGVNAYCNKDIDIDILKQVIVHVFYGAVWVDSFVSDVVTDYLSDNNRLSDKKLDNYNFTHREKEILKLLVNGYTNTQMSQKLSVSLHTVKAHICNILQKMNVNDRTQAAIKALKLLK